MSTLIWQGLIISVMGMGLTFVVMGLLIFTMSLLERFSRSGVPLPVAGDTASDKKPAVSAPARDTEEEVATAIAVALAYLRSADGRHAHLGATLKAGRGPWWAAGRTQQHSTHISKTTHRRN